MPDGETTDAPGRWAELAHAFDLVERTLGVLDEELGAVGAAASPQDGPEDGSEGRAGAGPGAGTAPRGPGDGSGTVRGSAPEAQENRTVRLAAARLARARSVELRRRHAVLVERFAELHRSIARVRRDSEALRREGTGPGGRGAADGRTDGTDGTDLVEVLEEGGRALLGAADTERACAAVVEATRRAVPAAPHVALLVDGPDGPAVRAATDELAELACALQARLGEGPAPEALRTGVPVVVHDLSAPEAASRRPGLAAPATGLGLRSVAAVPLLAAPRRHAAALVLHAPAAGAFGPAELARARLCAAQASVALAGALQAENLLRALASRDLIGQAKGVLMHVHGIDEGAAFEMLRDRSRNTNTKLVEIARRVLEDRPDGSDRGA
ncbi:GAF and ANTAR domain-containing protein [Pseudonocardia lutea]|uniref:GAF and ANTAR domain-containing protein n=1 Tax=Pseudonocardia lutea TaxID=2172015 RepID=A0ABW1I5A4_9PSEU